MISGPVDSLALISIPTGLQIGFFHAPESCPVLGAKMTATTTQIGASDFNGATAETDTTSMTEHAFIIWITYVCILHDINRSS